VSDTDTFDNVIIGAGIAGLSVADALMLKGYRCAVVDSKHPGSGASGAPRMLINPAAGRRAKMSHQAKAALPAVIDLLQRVQGFSNENFYEENGVIRPALYPEIGLDFKKSPEKYNWPEGWISWLNEVEFQKNYPVFKNQHGGLLIHKAITVEGSTYIKNLSGYLKSTGLETFYNTDVSYEKSDSGWFIYLNDGIVLKTKNVICASGTSLADNPDWQYLNLHLIKGQTVTLTFDRRLPLSHSISSLGYMAYMNKDPFELVVGSTYEHKFEHLNPDQKGYNYLLEKLESNLEGWSKHITHYEQWAGCRVTSKDKRPVIGEHPEHSGLYIFGALGSKGMVLGRYIAGKLADHITQRKKIDSFTSVTRFF
jgi:glycine oxidase